MFLQKIFRWFLKKFVKACLNWGEISSEIYPRIPLEMFAGMSLVSFRSSSSIPSYRFLDISLEFLPKTALGISSPRIFFQKILQVLYRNISSGTFLKFHQAFLKKINFRNFPGIPSKIHLGIFTGIRQEGDFFKNHSRIFFLRGFLMKILQGFFLYKYLQEFLYKYLQFLQEFCWNFAEFKSSLATAIS